jgi:Fic family protein
MRTPAGYSWLVEHYQLPVLPLNPTCYIDSTVRSREEKGVGEDQLMLFEPKYQPEHNLPSHLQFALRYEAVNLQVLTLLFQHQDSSGALCQWITQSPSSAYARRACFFYEWLTGQPLPIADPVPTKARYVAALDPDQQFASHQTRRSGRFKVHNNLPGNPRFCPLVRKTPFLMDMANKNLRRRTRESLQQYDADLLRRAAAYLYLKETQSSFEVEREKPSASRAQRFADLLREADTREPLTEDRLVELQHAVVDPRFHEYCWRAEQNWIGKDLGYRQQVDFVPARPEDLPELMQGLLEMAAQARGEHDGDPVINAAAIAFGFVFIHPFMDGNGRIHRYLVHDVLANGGFTPRGIVLPVSAVILANLDEYVAVLEAFSRPLRRRTDYSPDVPDTPAQGNDAVYFRFFDATPQAEFLYRALERTVEEDLQQEIDFLLGFDRAYQRLNNLLDWPSHSLELFIRVVHGNNGELSKNKRKSHFAWMTDEEAEQATALVRESFSHKRATILRKTKHP